MNTASQLLSRRNISPNPGLLVASHQRLFSRLTPNVASFPQFFFSSSLALFFAFICRAIDKTSSFWSEERFIPAQSSFCFEGPIWALLPVVAQSSFLSSNPDIFGEPMTNSWSTLKHLSKPDLLAALTSVYPPFPSSLQGSFLILSTLILILILENCGRQGLSVTVWKKALSFLQQLLSSLLELQLLIFSFA